MSPLIFKEALPVRFSKACGDNGGLDNLRI